MKPESNVTLQDWLDIVWQSAVQARDKGLEIQFVDLGGSVGLRIFGVDIRDGRPYLTIADEFAPQGIESDANSRADAPVASG
jgi:hypothetical protein